MSEYSSEANYLRDRHYLAEPEDIRKHKRERKLQSKTSFLQ